MKHISISTLVICLAAVLSCACDLVEKPTTTLTETAIYSTPEGCEAAVMGCYAAMVSGNAWPAAAFIEFLQNGSLLLHWKNKRETEDYLQAQTFSMYSVNKRNQGLYAQMYAIVNRCNSVIESVENSPMDEGYKQEIIAEATFLRAFTYFTLVRLYSDVPLVIRSPKSLEEANTPRTPYYEVYAQILADLEFAEQYMRTPERVEAVSGPVTGRVNRWAATSLKALVYLQIASYLSHPYDQAFWSEPDFTHCGIEDAKQAWTLTLQTAEEVINNGPYALAHKYTDLFRWTEEKDYMLKERIFALQAAPAAISLFNVTTYTLPEYPDGTANESAKNSNFGRIRPSRYFFQRFAKTYGGLPQTGREDGLTNVCVSCPDPRFDATFIYSRYFNLSTQKNVNIYPRDNYVLAVNSKGNEKVALPYFKKYLNPRYNANSGYADLYMMRYAEILLTAAEASAQLSTAPGDAHWQKAMAYVEQLHARARRTVAEGKAEAAQPIWAADRFEDKEELVNAIIFERFFEMACEGHEWFDTHRNGAQWMIDNIIRPVNQFLQEPEQQPGTGDSQLGYWQICHLGYTYSEDPEEVKKGLFCAFPDDEIRNNSSINYSDQNPYFVQ